MTRSTHRLAPSSTYWDYQVAAAEGFEISVADWLGANRHRAGVRVRLLGHAGGQSAARGRAEARPGQFEPGDDNDRSRSGGPHLYRADDAGGADEDYRARTAGRDPADGRRADRAEPGDRACRGGRTRSIQFRTYWGGARGAQESGGTR